MHTARRGIGVIQTVLSCSTTVMLAAACTSDTNGHHESGSASRPPTLTITSPAVTPTPTTITPLPAAQEMAIRNALSSTPGPVVAKALAPQLRAQYSRHPFRLLPAGSTVEVQTAHMTVTGRAATLPVDVFGGKAAGHWLVLLIKVDGQWLIYGTRRA